MGFSSTRISSKTPVLKKSEERVFFVGSVVIGLYWSSHTGSSEEGIMVAIGCYILGAVAQMIMVGSMVKKS